MGRIMTHISIPVFDESKMSGLGNMHWSVGGYLIKERPAHKSYHANLV